MNAIIKNNQMLILEAISKLARERNPININRVAKVTGLQWHTVAKYFKNNFYIKDNKK